MHLKGWYYRGDVTGFSKYFHAFVWQVTPNLYFSSLGGYASRSKDCAADHPSNKTKDYVNHDTDQIEH